ncbi:hypothetical protein PybrP1_011284 [[Pythium] brassicae (nom. inval.)]|nr:hypothetical protein PybrP1_011284 [[Pythium] brassicae (nom. inval.)]
MRAFSVMFVAATGLALCAAQDESQNEQQQQGRPLNPRSFATKTAYWDQRTVDDYDPLVLSTKLLAQEELKGLKLLQVQQINRHGSRFPTESNTLKIIELLERMQKNYSSVIPTWLRNYTLPYNVSVEGTLAPTGAAELFNFGARTRNTVAGSVEPALPTAFAKDKFILQHTYKSRTRESAKAFAKSFFANPQDVQYIEYSKKGDRFLRYYDECPRYNAEVADNATALPESAAYKKSRAMAYNIALLKSKLRLPSEAMITEVDVESAFSACAFDIALYNTYSNWCTLMDKKLLDSLDFAEDLDNFYENGPGYKISYEISAVLLKDVFGFMKDLIDGKTQVVGNFRFAHAETTLPLMALLGYGNRTPLLASFTADEIAFRGFRTSVLAPLAANIDFRLYESKSDSSKHFVQVLVNERVAPVPGCDGAVFCELSKIEELWSYYLTTYDFDADCKLN